VSEWEGAQPQCVSLHGADRAYAAGGRIGEADLCVLSVHF
jgi:hypothetical protein